MTAYRPSVWPSLIEVFLASAERFPDRPCFTAYDESRRSLTYAQARDQIAAVTKILDRAKIGFGDKVALTVAPIPLSWPLPISASSPPAPPSFLWMPS